MSSDLARRIAAEHAAAAESLPAAVVASVRRRRAIDSLLACGLPSARDENWRYANLRPLERVHFTPARSEIELTGAELPDAIPGYARYVFVDGVVSETLSHPVTFGPHVSVQVPSRVAPASELPRGDATDDPEAAAIEPPACDTAFALLNEAFAVDCARIDVGTTQAAASEPACIEVVFIASTPAQRGASYPRLRVHVASRARACLVERHVSLGAEPASFVNSAVDARIEEGASLEHYRLQQLDARAVWMDTLSARVARSGVYRLHAMGLGAASARSSLRVRLEGEGAELALHALAVGDAQQVLDTHAIVEHAAAHTRTDESFRGIAAARSRVAFNGKIIVQPDARGADSSQSLRGLLAGAKAEIDVRPQLEIYTDEVRCSHGATAGKLDETMLFYLLSRGLDADTAQRLLKWAFLEDVVARIGVAQLRRQVEESLAVQMHEPDASMELQ